MNLFEKLGSEMVERLVALNKKKQLVAIHAEPKGARIVMTTGETMLLESLSKDETTRLFKYLGFTGRGEGGFDTPAFAPHLKFHDGA